MREASFVKQNKEKWIGFENALENNAKINPDDLASYYIQLTNDLSYAQTYYPGSKTLLYLNSLASQAHQKIYITKKESKNKIVSFWRDEFPLFFYQYHKTLLYAFLIFMSAVIIGVVSTLNDDSFVRLILGDAYVNMTIENIENGEPMAVYKSGSNIGSFLGITINNIRVAILAFALGVFFSVGTIYVLFSNGIMLGAFITFFYNNDILEKTSTVWLHGTIEISVIVIAGCAGLVMGNSFLFPRTYSRRVAFMKGAKDGLKIVVSTIPFFIIAGFIEGFITRYGEQMPWVLAYGIIFVSLFVIVYYYIIYPITLHKANQVKLDNRASELIPKPQLT
ncbi:stage II sporulation protein M [Winogradskyella echinorum]|uniref:Stage II sporulation protein M n=1 Tax=Winogradskyella echinorum TaxID=538189 RepID=A0ABR6Y2B8_9FLAO|nr:stage II sporulation protein M [Winogradskyella echinorum]MBC3846855.1 stage II sporulation protein M [Winogradskyella echinorum]MBC5751203.1 stage II sporulation protein M [Winogradskyella echinorum]